MAQLGQVDVAAGVETALYAPAGSQKGSIRIVCVNRNTGTNARVRVVHRPGAGPTAAADFLAFDEDIPARESRVSPFFNVENPEEIRVQSDVTGVTFQANGLERT